MELTRQKLWTLYRAGYYAYTGETDRWESMIKRLLPEMRDNPYFRWFVTNKRRSDLYCNPHHRVLPF